MRIIALEQPVRGVADTRFSDAILRSGVRVCSPAPD
jgi:hypothetical protein